MTEATKALGKASRKFREFENFESIAVAGYYLLPFRFHRLNAVKEIIVNEAGDYLMVPEGTVQKIVNREVSKIDHAELYGDLIANFFISETPIPPLIEVLATRYRTKKSFLDNFTALHIFVMSLRCDHTCHYCQVSRVSADKSAYDMQHHHIEKGIEMMMKSPNPHVTMEFQGGEALLAFENIKYAVEKATQRAAVINKQISFVICTNLSPLTSEMLEFCKEHSVLISTSLDGPSFIHNQNRHKREKDSYERTLDGITRCREILGYDKVSALLTTTTLSLSYPEEIVDEYYRLGFRNIFLRSISPYGFAVKNPKKNYYAVSDFLTFYRKALDRIIFYNKEGFYFREDYAVIILKKILTPFPVGYVDLQSPAGMINNVIVFNYDGKIYATDESRMLAEIQDFTFQVGSLDTDSYANIFYGPEAQSFAESWSNEALPGCSDCAFQSYCGADPVFNHATQGDVVGHRPTSAFCKKNMTIIEYLFELMEDESVRKIFYSWINPGN
jgi:His-Xaa-Ser system radical SAM maturase HxsB